MTEEQLKKGREIGEKINKFNSFIYNAENLWTGKLKIRKPKMFLISNSYGAFKGDELFLDNELKNEVLEVIKKKRDMLEMELEEI